MKNTLQTIIRLVVFGALLSWTATVFAQAKAGEPNLSVDDTKLYTEVKTALAKYEESLNGEATAADLHQVALTLGSTVTDSHAKNTNQFEDLLVKCDLLISHNPNLPDYYRLRGKARYYKSISNSPYIFIESVSLADPNFTARFSPAEIAAGIKDFSAALSFSAAAKLTGLDAADAYLFRGKLYAISAARSYSKEHLQEALTDFDESIKLDEYDPPPDGFRKGIYLISRDGDLVGQDFARRVRENPAAARQIYLERARYLSTIVEYSKVLADLLRYASSNETNDATAKSIIALTYATLNKYAGDAYKRSTPASSQDYLEKASIEIQFSEKLDDAFNDATEAIKRNPLLTSAHVIRAKVLIERRKPDEAIAEANVALAQDADSVGALCIRGLGFAINNDMRTLADFDRAISLDPELAFLYNAFGNRAKVFSAFGKTDLAAADMLKNEQLARKLGEVRK
jgi:tetratricopeptide (TPR) repeat protein